MEVDVGDDRIFAPPVLERRALMEQQEDDYHDAAALDLARSQRGMTSPLAAPPPQADGMSDSTDVPPQPTNEPAFQLDEESMRQRRIAMFDLPAAPRTEQDLPPYPNVPPWQEYDDDEVTVGGGAPAAAATAAATGSTGSVAAATTPPVPPGKKWMNK